MFNAAKLKFDDIFENRLSAEEVKEYLIELYKKKKKKAEIAGAACPIKDNFLLLPVP